VCPQLAEYPAELQAQVADEMDLARERGAAWPILIDDYGALRVWWRAACGGSTPR
jgi:hypothetical protein